MILLVGDIHLSDKPPSSCTDSYTDDLFDLLDQAREVASANEVDAVVWAGDVFHHKQPSRVSHRLVQRAIDLIEKYPCPVFIVPGNHDMLNDRYDSVFETQPLGVLLSAGAQLLNRWDYSDYRYNLPIYGVPWLGEFTDETVDAALAQFGRVEDADALVIAHAPIFPPGQENPYECFPAAAWAERQRMGWCFYGHVHERHGTYQVGNVTFCNNGAVTRGSLHEYNLKRGVSVTLWSPDSGFEEVALKAKPPEAIFRLHEKIEAKDAAGRLDEFLASVGQATLDVTSTEAVVAHVKTLGLDADLVDLIEELLAQ